MLVIFDEAKNVNEIFPIRAPFETKANAKAIYKVNIIVIVVVVVINKR